LEFMPLAEFRRQLEVNLVGQLAVTQAVLPALGWPGGSLGGVQDSV
jgi:NAD(P)-dependent dehydrogenase (short-subunit alcohol dehydrogenase family)